MRFERGEKVEYNVYYNDGNKKQGKILGWMGDSTGQDEIYLVQWRYDLEPSLVHSDHLRWIGDADGGYGD